MTRFQIASIVGLYASLFGMAVLAGYLIGLAK